MDMKLGINELLLNSYNTTLLLEKNNFSGTFIPFLDYICSFSQLNSGICETKPCTALVLSFLLTLHEF